MSHAIQTRTSAVEQAMSAIREAIAEGHFAPGHRLIEADVTSWLGLSRSTVRNALGRLATEGLLTIEPNRGAVVRRMTREEAADLYDIRQALQGLAARRASERATSRDLAALGAMIRKMTRAIDKADFAAYRDQWEQFNDRIAEMSGNAELASLVRQYRSPVYRLQLWRLFSSAVLGDSLSHYEKVLAAMRKGDSERAEGIMRQDILQWRERIQTLPDSVFD
jgi:DNA-binding GntR family transcriptional regulator